jgi:hypothetical protein
VRIIVETRRENGFGLASYRVEVTTPWKNLGEGEPEMRVVSSGWCLRLSHAFTYARERARVAGFPTLPLESAVYLARLQADLTLRLQVLVEAERQMVEMKRETVAAGETFQQAVQAAEVGGAEVSTVCRRLGV